MPTYMQQMIIPNYVAIDHCLMAIYMSRTKFIVVDHLVSESTASTVCYVCKFCIVFALLPVQCAVGWDGKQSVAMSCTVSN